MDFIEHVNTEHDSHTQSLFDLFYYRFRKYIPDRSSNTFVAQMFGISFKSVVQTLLVLFSMAAFHLKSQQINCDKTNTGSPHAQKRNKPFNND